MLHGKSGKNKGRREKVKWDQVVSGTKRSVYKDVRAHENRELPGLLQIPEWANVITGVSSIIITVQFLREISHVGSHLLLLMNSQLFAI